MIAFFLNLAVTAASVKKQILYLPLKLVVELLSAYSLLLYVISLKFVVLVAHGDRSMGVKGSLQWYFELIDVPVCRELELQDMIDHVQYNEVEKGAR